MLRADDIEVTFDGVPALARASIEVATGETLALLGPSGCGKTTLLRVIAGLQEAARGRVALDDRELDGIPAHRRRVGLMFQDNVLFPHRDVAANVAFGLRMEGRPRRDIDGRVADLLELVGLPDAGRRSVQTLSGGEQQRVALARALAPEPRALLLDEPLGALDGPLRERLLDDLRALFDRLRLTVLYVTHDVGEAFALGHHVALMRTGRVVQTGTPDALWERPADAWVATFLGMRNVQTVDGRTIVVRPEAVTVAPGSGGTIASAERRGSVVWLRVRMDDGRELDAVTTRIDHPRPGDTVSCEIDARGVIDLED